MNLKPGLGPRIGLVTTTINIPCALELIARQDETLQLYIAADLNTPPEAEVWCYDNLQPKSRVSYLTPDMQRDLNYKSSELIGWNTDSRRNIALLEAMRDRCELIISWDDDMICYKNFVEDFADVFAWPYSGLQVGLPRKWVNINALTIPISVQRGLPADGAQQMSGQPSCIVGAEIGAAQGVILGVPDATATHAIETASITTGMSDILRNGLVVDPRAYTVFNSQLTMFRAELAPAFAQFYFAQGRNTDIFSSLLMRRFMRDRDLYTYYGLPAAFHARKPRPLLKDLQAERYGVDNIVAYAEYLDRAPLPDMSIIDKCRTLAEGWRGPELEAAMAFYDDCERVA